jgi:predicted RNA binding protein YcfA (HicA-like mRNA interferase family)
MPRKYKILSGADVVKIFKDSGFEVVSQKGSHIKLCKINSVGERQILVIPLHKELAIGTIKAMYMQSLQYIPETELRKYFII